MASKKKKMHDRISNLPEQIVDQILSRLPLSEAVQTSLLSRDWRFKWVTLPCLVFDEKSVFISSRVSEEYREEAIVRFVDSVLLLHNGPIHKFELRHPELHLTAVTNIDRWICDLSRCSVKELILHVRDSDKYKVPSSMYSFEELAYLELYDCVLKPPPEFNGFKSLKCLHLQSFSMQQVDLEQMISSCPILESLTLKPFLEFSVLNIHAPNLAYLEIHGMFDEVRFTDTFNLVDVSICLALVGDKAGNIINFFTGLPHIQRLRTEWFFLQYLACGTVPEKLPAACLDLTYLSIHLDFNDLKENLAVLCLLRSSPNLRELVLRGQTLTSRIADHNTMDTFESFPLKKLQLIKMFGLSGSRRNLNLIKLLLANTPLLQTVTVQLNYNLGREERDLVVKAFLRFRRASTSAQIIYFDPLN